MRFIDFQKQLKKRAKLLSYEERVAFGIDICKRLFFEYRAFVNESGFGNPDVLLDAIRYVETGGVEPHEINQYLERLEEVTPETDDYGGASYALNACVAVCELLSQVLAPMECEHFIEVATAYYDTADGKAQDLADELSEVQIDMHPLITEAKRYILGA